MPVDSTIRERAERAIQEKVFPGCVIGVSRNGKRDVMPFGRFTYEETSPAVSEDTTYDIASITKSIPTASLALLLAQEGRLGLGNPVSKYLPELRNDFGATVEDLMLYRVRGVRMSELAGKSAEEIAAHVLENGFAGPPGERVYTNLPSYILGMVLEAATKQPLAELAQEYIFFSLKMTSTSYFPSKKKCPPTEIQAGEVIQGIVHDESARVFGNVGHAVGHAGLFSSAPDLLGFAEALMGGKLKAVMEGAVKGLGWSVQEKWFMGARASEAAFGKTGFTGTCIVVDPQPEVSWVILSNRCYPTRPSDAISITSAMNLFRKDIADIVLG